MIDNKFKFKRQEPKQKMVPILCPLCDESMVFCKEDKEIDYDYWSCETLKCEMLYIVTVAGVDDRKCKTKCSE